MTARLAPIGWALQEPIHPWAMAQHRACHDAPRVAFRLPDRDELIFGCAGCGWQVAVTRFQLVRWFGFNR